MLSRVPIAETIEVPYSTVVPATPLVFDLQSGIPHNVSHFSSRIVAAGQTAQILWSQYVSTTDATAGVRRAFVQVRDETAAVVLTLSYFATQAAGSALGITFAQGLTIVPASVLGLVTTLPADGLFVKNRWTLTYGYFPFISAGDVFSGFFQSRGLHNSAAP